MFFACCFGCGVMFLFWSFSNNAYNAADVTTAPLTLRRFALMNSSKRDGCNEFVLTGGIIMIVAMSLCVVLHRIYSTESVVLIGNKQKHLNLTLVAGPCCILPLCIFKSNPIPLCFFVYGPCIQAFNFVLDLLLRAHSYACVDRWRSGRGRSSGSGFGSSSYSL